MCRPLSFAVILVLLALSASPAFALILGGEGNKPITDPGWPAGAEPIFNHESRVAYWEGPPFGGGHYTSENRGDARTLQAILERFAKLEIKNKRVVLYDGRGQSFWLNINREPEKKEAARIDWSFSVWVPENWERLRKMPFARGHMAADGDSPPCVLTVYTGGLDWSAVILPDGLVIDDQRLSAHGFKLSDGSVLEGKVLTFADQKPLAAMVKLEAIKPRKSGGYDYELVSTTKADDAGRWVFTKTSAGWYRVVVEAEGYVPRTAGYITTDDEPRWHPLNTELAKAASVSGQIVDEAGKPLAEVEVRFGDVIVDNRGGYETPQGFEATTDADGKFRIDTVNKASGRLWISKQGYVRPGLGQEVTAPTSDVKLSMVKSASLRVTVDFTRAKRPEGYIVNIEDATGAGVGKWGGSANLDEKNEVKFEHMPPGRYTLFGRPNPGSEREETERVTVELKGGEHKEVTLSIRGGT